VSPRTALALTLVVLAVPASAQAASGRSVSRSTVIDKGRSGFSVSCPGKTVALNGAVLETSEDVVTTRSAPSQGARRWRFGFQSQAQSRVRTVLRCAPVNSPGSFRVASRTKRVILRAGGLRRVTITCPKGLVPTGYGQEQPGGGDNSADPGTVALFKVLPTGHGMSFGLRNNDTEQGRGGVFLRCWQRRVYRGPGVRVRQHLFRDALPADRSTTAAHSCGRGQYALATGWKIGPSGVAFVSSSYPQGQRKGRWFFENTDVRVRATTSLLCLV
jgi:hypothetical protein